MFVQYKVVVVVVLFHLKSERMQNFDFGISQKKLSNFCLYDHTATYL